MRRLSFTSFSLGVLALTSCLTSCLTNEPDPNQGGIYACVADEDCPGSQICLQQTCEAITAPALNIFNPEENETIAFGGGPHTQILTLTGTDLILRPRAESNEAVPGEGHVVVFVDEMPVAEIEVGDLTGGVQTNISIPDTPGAHRIRVQARLNDGTNYDNEAATARRLIWVDNGRQQIALRKPWPKETFSLDSQLIQAEAVGLNGILIGAPMTGDQHVHVFYNRDFPGCIDDNNCVEGYNGVVPNNEDDFGPVQLPAAGAGPAVLTALTMNPDHTVYLDEMGEPVWSQIEILRSNN